MKTPNGTSYATLQRLALRCCPDGIDCREAERVARELHRQGRTRLALQALLIARALWSARRALTIH